MEMYPRKTLAFEEGWSSIQFGITKFNRMLGGLHRPEFPSEEYMTLKTTIYNMCTQKPPNDYSQQLYEKYKQAFEEYINSSVLPSLREKQGEFMLRELMRGWENYKAMVKWLSNTFSYLDRFFIVSKALPKLNVVGFTCFRELVYQELKVKVRDAVITLIDQERGGEQIDLALLKNVVNLFVEIWDGQMDDYENFEDDMLKGFASYYTLKSSTWIDEDSCPDYMFKAEQCLKEERDRVSHYLRPSSEQKLLEIMQQKMLVEHSAQLLDKHSVCRGLLRDAQLEDHLSRMYRLFHEIPEGLKPIADIFEQHITAEGTALVQQAEDAPSVKVSVRKVIELHDKCMTYVKDCFANHSLFRKALNKAFQLLCNKNVSGWSSAELLASFCDYILKKDGVEKLSDKEIEDTLDKVVELLAYIEDKDLFVEFYWKNLSRRLLSDENANDKHERLMLTKLNKVLFGLTCKMEQMVTDLTLSKENQNHFEEYIGSNPNANPGINLTVSVITGGFWPRYICKSSDLYLPPEMVKCVTVFQNFFQEQGSLSYQEQRSLPLPKRRLSWIYSLGTCQINGNFEQKTIELTVETYQAAALLLFNVSDRLSYSEILTQLNMADDVLVRVLKSLACAEYQILNKLPSNKKVTRGDHFEFNAKFTHRTSRIKIPLPPADEREGVVEEVTKDRRYLIDASIVRIMKSRKVLHLQELVTQCAELLRPTFKADSKAIKKQIEKLMDREYLERDKDDPELFHYLV